jgi:hypothetical protein
MGAPALLLQVTRPEDSNVAMSDEEREIPFSILASRETPAA